MEKSSGFIIYRKEKNDVFYLLLKYPPREEGKEYWGFPKGHLENDEDLLEAAIRELEEETGIKKNEIDIKKFKKWIKYFFKRESKNVFKIVVYFLAETKKESVELSSEHLDYKWVNYAEAKEMISFSNTEKVLSAANDIICQHSQSEP